MKKRSTRRKFKIRKILILILILAVIFVLYYFKDSLINTKHSKKAQNYIASETLSTALYDKNIKSISNIVRGSKIDVLKEYVVKDKITYKEIKYKNKNYFINSKNITSNIKDIVEEKNIYVRTSSTIYTDLDKGLISGLASKGSSLEVLGYDKLNKDGSVNVYKIKNDNTVGYIYGKYTVLDHDSSLLNYEPDKYYNIHQKRGNIYNGGHAGNLDYYPVDKPKFDDNVMPDDVYALYLNDSANVISNVDAYINYAKSTKINAFVIDIKDNQTPGYKSRVFEAESPTNYQYANNSFDQYKAAIRKIKQAGFYTIGRITVFKDKYYVDDNPDIAILDTRTKTPYLHADTFWPSPFQRKVWMFNVDLAKEAVKEMGFNEIQFDYVRFPDRTISDEKNGIMDFRNSYNEDKSQAVQRFLMYATDELHKLHAYVSADVFGESAYTYVTAYGQYWPAISNVVDVISGMPYPDHFNEHEFGFTESVWTTPYKLLNYWASNYVVKRQAEIPTPAVVRTWIQVSDVSNYKQPGGYKYGDKEIDEEIRGLFDAGLTGGYMTWLSTSSLDRYKSEINIYSKEY